jgi:hypothetical protein
MMWRGWVRLGYFLPLLWKVNLISRLGAQFDSHPDYLGNRVLSARSTYSMPGSLSPKKDLIPALTSSIMQSLEVYARETMIERMATLNSNPGMVDDGDLQFTNWPGLYMTDVRRYSIDNDWRILEKPIAIPRCCRGARMVSGK